MTVLRSQLIGALRRPARMLLTGLAILVVSFVVFAAVLAQRITERTIMDNVTGTPAAVDLVVGGQRSTTTEALRAARMLPGVAEAEGRLDVSVTSGASDLHLSADPGTGPLATTRVIGGGYPVHLNEVAVTRRTAERTGLQVGSTSFVRAGEDTAPVELRVTGVVDAPQDTGAEAFTLPETVVALFGEDYLARIDLRLAPGADVTAVTSALEARLGPDEEQRPEIRTGAEVRAEEARRAVSDLDAVFGLVAMFVAISVVAAALVATSTFRIVFAQRMRQLALLRAVGANRGELVRALAAEGALIGLVTGAVGVVAALALGLALPGILGAAGIAVSSPGVPVVPALLVVAGAVLVSVVAVLAPAFAVAGVSPVEALRSAGTTAGRVGIGKARTVTGVVLAIGAVGIAVAVTLTVPHRVTASYDPEPKLLAIVLSGAMAYFALVVLGPVLLQPLLKVVGRPLRQAGPIGRLAVSGLGAAPRRAAAISVVVALGVTLIAGALVGGASLRTLADSEVALAAPADFEVTPGLNETVPPAAVDKVRGLREVTRVVPYRRLTADVGGAALDVTDLDLRAVPALAAVDAADGSVTEVSAGHVALASRAAERIRAKVGDAVTLVTGQRRVRVTVVAVMSDAAPLGADVLADHTDLDRLGAGTPAAGVLADASGSGEDGRSAAVRALRQATQDDEGLDVTVLADKRDENTAQVDAILGGALGLIALTVMISVVGVGTTTALSVVERRRESGLLRALGMSRRGLRTMLTAESSLYGVIGATIGLALGVPYAWLAVHALGMNAGLRVPVAQLAVVFVILVVVTALAGVLPARRAGRVSPVAALGTDG